MNRNAMNAQPALIVPICRTWIAGPCPVMDGGPVPPNNPGAIKMRMRLHFCCWTDPNSINEVMVFERAALSMPLFSRSSCKIARNS